MDNDPELTFRRLLDLLLAKDMDAVADLWAVDGTAEFPFAEAGSPTRLEGREQVRAYLAGYPDLVDVAEIPELVVHRTADPSTAVVEFTAVGRTTATGAPYRLDYVSIVTVVDGLFTAYRDYWSPVAAARATGGLGDLVAALDREATA
ncbi:MULTISPECIES: nuclear transport factor 2 family protein [Actinosynnema]|uniref:SnoaL-like domain-containing protein n=1 Tax=Actinosynnema pretiosum TaxID=42197 RepID=A0A290Z1Y1_9PSEU|nr:nuclear transport factor 2 family protein [Actinosynnema pretiosum]ATE53002.1 hypothetical protein CNX65_06665 [Actinosynnema pretiosum]